MTKAQIKAGKALKALIGKGTKGKVQSLINGGIVYGASKNSSLEEVERPLSELQRILNEQKLKQ